MGKREIDYQHAQKEIAAGRMTSVITELRRQGRRGWTLLHDLHNAEKADVLRLRALTGSADETVHVAIEPESGRLGVFVVPAPEQEIDFANGGAAPADPMVKAAETASILQAQVLGSFDAATEVLRQYAEGRQVFCEEVFDALPAGVSAASVREILKQAHLESRDVEIAGRIETLGGHRNVPRQMPSRTTYNVLADVRSVNRDGKPNGTATVKIVSVQSSITSAAFPIHVGSSFTAELRTTVDQRSLALLYLAGAYSQAVNLKLGMAIDLNSGRTEFFIKEVDEEELIRCQRPIQAILEGL